MPAAKPAPPPAVPEPPKEYVAAMFPGPEGALPDHLASVLARLRDELEMPLWLLLQDGYQVFPFSSLNGHLVEHIQEERGSFAVGERIALVINSPGGDARAAYILARSVCRRTRGFLAVVPDSAMSAATLLALGADSVLMGQDAFLGPLDAQVWDPEAETNSSVLNEVQALERLRAYSLESIDETMSLLLTQTGKRIDSLLPHVLKFVSDSMRPLMEKIDVVHYNERARILKVAEEYAVRLLRPRHPEPDQRYEVDEARQIASRFVENYPEHGFPIDREEARTLGVDVAEVTEEQERLLDELRDAVQGVTAVGLFGEKEVTP